MKRMDSWRCEHHGSEEQQLSRCGLCQDVTKDPVSTSCGHWFCRQCLTSFWDQSGSSGCSYCPQCRKRSRTNPSDMCRQGDRSTRLH
uniref:RING-type domain-containing protein n=1 Tax=Monopterus albus TaxID=43700 RepID=A0A3Q3IFD6_MONAL